MDATHDFSSFARRQVVESTCAGQGVFTDMMPMRIASIFIVFVASIIGALFPILARRHSRWLRIPRYGFEIAKFFGSGVIISTAFMHLLSPGVGSLASDCLSEPWHRYPYALGLCMLSVFLMFIVEVIAFRWGMAKLADTGLGDLPAHRHGVTPLAHNDKDESTGTKAILESANQDIESVKSLNGLSDGERTALRQVVGIAILEFGVVFHSILIGLTFAVSDNFKILFIVIVFHQFFEGLGIGSRLAYMNLGPKYRWVPYAGALLFGVTTPIGIAAGIGARSTYDPTSNTSLILNGVMYSVSAGIMLYTGLVELLAQDFLFDPEMQNATTGRLAVSLASLCTGAVLMSVLGIWI